MLTEAQKQARELIGGEANRLLLYGGARSGKTYLLVLAIFVRAMKAPGRHLIARLRYSHAHNALWLDTIPQVIKDYGIEGVKYNRTDHFLTVPTKDGDISEIWIDGLDDKDRVDKILGREYATIYLNEVSQIAWPTVTTVLTRLAQNVPGLKNRAYFDCNPPSKHHWSYKLFIQGEDPETGEAITNPEHYGYIRMNPGDNAENLPDGYIEDVLEHLPEDKRRRFLLGEYGDSAGAIFTNWEIIEEIGEDVKHHSRRAAGLDFGFSVDPAALVDVYVNGDDVYVDELIYDKNLTNQQLAERIKRVGLERQTIEADSAEPKSIRELNTAGLRVRGVEKGADSVRAGVDWLRSKRLHITKRSVDLITELQEYVWSQDRDGNFEPKPIDDYNHAIDALRYAVDPMRRRTGRVSKVSAGRLGL
jgi:phage terminase large subunit